MLKPLTILFGGLWGVGLILVGLWAWQGAEGLVGRFEVQKPELVLWAVRGGAVAVFALAQAVLLTFVGNGFYRRDRFTDVIRVTAAGIALLAFAAALGLGVAGR